MKHIKVTDSLLKKVLPKVSDELIDEWEKCEEESQEFSFEFNSKIKQAVKKENRFREKGFYGRIAVGFVGFICVFLFADTLVARAGWDIMFNRIEVALEDASMYIYDYDTDIYGFTPFEPGYVPKGYEVIDKQVSNERVNFKYANEEGELITWKQMLVTDGAIAGSDEEYDEVIVKEYAGENVNIYVYESGVSRLHYEIGNCVFTITGTDLKAKEIYKMIKSMQRIE